MKTRLLEGFEVKKPNERGQRGEGAVAWSNAHSETMIRKTIKRIAEGKTYGAGTIVNMCRESAEKLPTFWDDWAELFELAFAGDDPKIKWGEPIYPESGLEVIYESFDDFYQNECAAWLGPYEALQDKLLRFSGGKITREQGAAEIEALCQAARDNPIAEQGGAREGAGRPAADAEPDNQGDNVPLNNKPVNQVDNINLNNEPKGGTGKTYTLRRLARDRPDLLAKVEAGELSAHAAAIEAGFRKKPTPLEAARKAFEKLTPDQRARFLAEIAPPPGG